MEREKRIKELFYQNYPQLCNVAYRYLLDRQRAEDVVQETFIKFWEHGKDSLPDNEVGYYLTRSVKNNCISYLRKEMEHVSLSSSNPLREEPAEDDDVEQFEEKVVLLEQAINNLPPKCKSVFIMCKMERKKYKEVADVMDISVKTVENQMAKAVSALREYILENKSTFNLSKLPGHDS